jgi:two-component system sensor histidine kinase DesK
VTIRAVSLRRATTREGSVFDAKPAVTYRVPIGATHAAQQHHSVAGWRRGAGVFLIYLVYAIGDLVSNHTWPTIVLGFALMAAFVWLYLDSAPRAAIAKDRRHTLLALIGMPLVTAVYLAVCGGGGIVFATYLAVAFIMILPQQWSLPLVVAMTIGVTYGPMHVHRWDMHGPQYAVGGPVLLVAIAMYGLRFNRRAQLQLEEANQEIGRLAAGQERLRIARDLHDLLGHALTTVTVKSELAAKLAERDPARAAQEMREVAALARQGLADVR